MVSELVTLMDVGDMNLYRGAFQGADAILKGYAGMGISPGVEYDTVEGESHLLQLVYKFALDIALVVFNLHVRIELAQFWKVCLK